MKDYMSWLNEDKRKRQSKFLNQRLKVNEEYIGIYRAAKKAKNNYGNTFHYYLINASGGIIFDNNSTRIAKIFSITPWESRVFIKKIMKNEKIIYEVKPLNTVKDEEELAIFAKGSERAREGRREENKRDERLDENEIKEIPPLETEIETQSLYI